MGDPRPLHAFDARRLTGRHLVITGGTGGIGRSCAEKALELGALVTVLGRTPRAVDDLNTVFTGRGARGRAYLADVRHESSVRTALSEAEAQFGPIDVLVNNAATSNIHGPFDEVGLDAWWDEFEINVRGVATCAQLVLPGMLARGHGRIINMVSGTAGRPSPYNSSYSSSKAAVVRFTDCLAAEVGERGVQVFALRPGNVRSPMTERFEQSETVHHWLGDVLPTLDLAPPDLAVSALMWLCCGHGDALSGRWVDADQDLAAIAEHASEVIEADLHQLRRVVWAKDNRATRMTRWRERLHLG